jgi:ribonuclease HII
MRNSDAGTADVRPEVGSSWAATVGTPQTAADSGRIPRAPKRARSPKRSGRRLFAFDRQFGHRFVAGADEAGRGCLAGPLFAAAVLFDLERLTLADRRALARLNDSKQHTEAGREELYPVVMRSAAKAVIVSRCVRGIDARGLHKTNLAALRQGLMRVAPPDALCLVDGFRVPDFGIQQRAVVGGDSRSAAIAAASVLAKVARDRFMHRAAKRHPGWDFETNVGYSTPEHRAAIRANGISPLHRMSFASIAYTQLDLEGVFDMVEGHELPPGIEHDAYCVEAHAAGEPVMDGAPDPEPLSGHQP